MAKGETRRALALLACTLADAAAFVFVKEFFDDVSSTKAIAGCPFRYARSGTFGTGRRRAPHIQRPEPAYQRCHVPGKRRREPRQPAALLQ